MALPKQKNNPINIRALESQKQLIDKASQITRKNRSEFILESACREAENVLLDQRLFFVDAPAYDKFMDLLESRVEENLGLKMLLQEKSPWQK